MIVKDVQLHRPLVLNTHGDSPAYVGCIVSGNKWEFRAATANEFDNGNIELDTLFATASFLLENPRCDPNHPKILGVDSMLSRSRGLITGAEFYSALPSAYGYRDHFSDCIKEVCEVYDDNSWFGLAYLAKLEIPARTHDFPDKGYVIHPSILDSIIQSALAIFINVDTKLSDVNNVFLPVKIDALSRWDSAKFADIISGFRDVVWVYITVRAFAPEGPLKFDYTVADSQYRVILTIEGFELVLAPQADQNLVSGIRTDERLTSIWQPKDFPSSNFSLHPHRSADILSDLRSNFETLIVNAQMAGRHVVRVLDMTQSLEIVKVLDASLVSLFSHGILVDYFFAATSAEDIEVNLGSLQYSYIRPLVADVLNDREGEHALQLSRYAHYIVQRFILPILTYSFDVLLQMVDVSRVPTDLATHLGYLVPFGVILLLVTGE
jgi:Polyketide synthase dehydratase